jgi:hypothetical protein
MLQVPVVTPVTKPDAFTIATAGLLLLQAPVPPLRTTPLALKTADAPIQRGLVLVIDTIPAFGFMVTDT